MLGGFMAQKKRIGEMLIDDGLLTEEQLKKILSIQKENPERKFGEILVQEGIVDKKVLTQYLLAQMD